MSKLTSVDFLRKVSHHGLIQPMYDRFRLGEIADELELTTTQRDNTIHALKLAMRLIADHLSSINPASPEVQELIASLDAANLAVTTDNRLVEGPTPIGEYEVVADPETGRLMSNLPVSIERTSTGRKVAEYMPAPPEQLDDEAKFGIPRPETGPLRFSQQQSNNLHTNNETVVEADK